MASLESENTDESRARIENLDEFLNVVIEFETENANNTLADFLENLALVTDLDGVDENEDNILLMTLHTAKGLEFPVVFMVGMEDGLFPSNRSIGEALELEEERRLCYVGITRAKDLLYMTCAKSRTVYGSTSYAMPSRFLKEIPENLYEGSLNTSLTSDSDFDEFSYKNREESFADWQYSGNKKTSYLSSEFGRANSDKAFSFKSAESFLNILKPNNPVDISEYKVGQKVEHKKFGIGIITGIEPEDDDLKVEIEFEKFGMKRLMAKFAGIKILENN